MKTVVTMPGSTIDSQATDRVSQVFTYCASVRFDDTDANGHVNNARYNAYCDEAAMRVFAAGGMDVAAAGASGIGAITRRAEYEYLSQLRYGDAYIVKSTIQFTKPTRIVFRHEVHRESDQECVCRCTAYGLWMDFRTGRPHKLSADRMLSILGGQD
ncbi:MAG: thioesterase family protein [Planctomycetota bacterium]